MLMYSSSVSSGGKKTTSQPEMLSLKKHKTEAMSSSILQHRPFHSVQLLLAVLLIAELPAVALSRSIPRSVGLQAMDSSLESLPSIQSDSEEHLLRGKRGINDPTFWPNKTIPYVFKLPFSNKNRKRVLAAMSEWEENSCIRFVERTNEEFFTKFEMNSYTCESNIGMKQYAIFRNKGQPVKLTTSCLKHHPSLVHELGHLIGFYHEHQRPDRDDYVQIQSQNLVKSKYSLQFQKYDFETYGPYDLGSIMHYSLDHFAKFGTHTIQVLPGVTIPEGVTIGHVATISELDAEKARLMYQCPQETTTEAPTEVDNNIYAGVQVGLSVHGKIDGMSFSENSWLCCTEQQCTVSSCPGGMLEEGDKTTCPFNTFTLHKLHVGAKSEPSSAVIRVGDAIVLEHRTPAPPTTTDSTTTTATSTGAPETEGALQQQQEEKSFFVSCDPDTQVCSLSLECTANISDYNTTSLCQQNVLIVRAEGKEDGTPITSHDLIGFEYRNEGSQNPFFTKKCAFGCDPKTNVCAKEVCIHATNNDLDLGNTLPDESEAPRCGRDMFRVQTF